MPSDAKDGQGVEHDDLRKCPSCYEGQSPMIRLGERTREDDVLVVGWECLSCGSYVSEHVGDGKIADMVDETPRVGETVTDGGVDRSESGVSRDDDEWWKCPIEDCDGETQVVHRQDVSKRECTECDWSFTFPTNEEVN